MACDGRLDGAVRAVQRACCLGRRFNWCTLEEWPKRCVLVFLLFLGFSLSAGIRRSFTEAAFSLQEEAHFKALNNETSMSDWSTEFIRSMQSTFTWGLFIGHVIGSALAYKYPANGVFAAAIALDSALHLVVAGVMQVHQMFLISLLFLQGVADGVTFPAFLGLLRYWAPPMERTRMFTVGYAGLHFGSLLSYQVFTLFRRVLSSTAGLYFYGTVGILWVLPWFLLVSESPSKHPTVSTREKIYIVDSLHQHERVPFSQIRLPMKSILSSGPVWAILVASFSRTWTFNTLLHISKWHYGDEVRYTKELSYFLMMISVCISGFLADVFQEKNIMTTSTVRKTFGGTGLLAEGVFFLSLVCLGPTNAAMVLYFMAMAVREIAVAGEFRAGCIR
ncbi:vesicular glutamate transporter 2.1-like [Ornithodoros turicata]|uniref:vesicular glutamate transporter 2.1-like n=1 Tax=Ornithodoros turicata TaxID=34597 RepID=UPI003139127E